MADELFNFMPDITAYNFDFADMIDITEEYIVPTKPRHIYERDYIFEKYDCKQFFSRFSPTKESVLNVLQQIEGSLEYFHNQNNSISPINKLLICLRVYATGGHLMSIGDMFGADKSTISRIVVKVMEAINMISRVYIKMPNNLTEIAMRQNAFYDINRFPKVLGAIDCTHIKILSPGGADAEIFRNRKGYFSLNVQIISSADLLIQDLVARWPGSAHDSTIFNSSGVKYRFERGDFGSAVLLGDSGYMCRPYVLTPFRVPATLGENNYNRAHISTRVRVEHLFGIWNKRFPILAYGSRLKLDTTLSLILATAVLHNICILRGEPEPPPDDDVNQHELQQLIANGDIPDIIIGNERNNIVGHIYCRNLVENYFP